MYHFAFLILALRLALDATGFLIRDAKQKKKRGAQDPRLKTSSFDLMLGYWLQLVPYEFYDQVNHFNWPKRNFKGRHLSR
jgi:hypothetical protein